MHPNTALTIAHANPPVFLGETDEWEEDSDTQFRQQRQTILMGVHD